MLTKSSESKTDIQGVETATSEITISKKPPRYNYPRFHAGFHDLRHFPGPRAGEHFPPLALFTLAGEQVGLRDVLGNGWIVLETGSFTCPMYARNVHRMKRLASEFTDVSFVMLYVREAHPGESVPAHQSTEEKIERAGQLQRCYQDERTILVDDVSGTAHQQIGFMPNLVYVIAPDGRVIYRCDWSVVTDVRRVLSDRSQLYPREHTEPFLRWSFPNPLDLWAGGWRAVWDFIIDVPRLIKNHARAEKHFQRTKRMLR